MKIYHIILAILFWSSIDYCTAQQKTFTINLDGEEITAPIYLKNGIPMIPIDIFFWLPESSYTINNNKITAYNKTYSLIEIPDTVNNRIFVSADFFTRIMNEPLYIDFVNKTVRIYDTGRITQECTLFVRKETRFSINLENPNNESNTWTFKITPDDGIALIDQTSSFALTNTAKRWIQKYDEKTGTYNRQEEDRWKTIIFKIWTFEAKETGQFVIIFENAEIKKEFKVFVVDDN